MGWRSSSVVYRVAVRGGEGLALFAAAGGALAVSHQLEHRWATNSGPLAGLHSRQEAPSIVFATAPPAQRGTPRQRVTLPAVFPRRTGPTVTTPTPERTRQTPPSPPSPSPPASPAPAPASPAPPTPSQQTSPAPTSTASTPQPGGTPNSPAVRSLTETSTRLVWGHGDRNHNHTRPPGTPPSTNPLPTPTTDPTAPTKARGTSDTSYAQAHETAHGHDGNPRSLQPPDPGVPPASTPTNPPADSGTDHGNGSARGGHH